MTQELEIRQHNALTNARYEYTELQLDLLFFLLSKLRKSNNTGVYELIIKELSDITGKRYDYSYLRKATEGMGSRMFEVETDSQLLQLWMFRYVKYLKGQGTIEIKLSEEMLPYLFDLKNNFTSFELLSALRLTSKHAKRIYTICSQWKDLGETKKYDILEFKRILGLVDTKSKEEYAEITMFKKFVLDVAVRQINEHTDLRISYQLEKRVRTYKSIVFKVELQAVDMVATLPDLGTTAQPLPGVAAHQVENAGRLLAQLGIATPALVTQILGNAAHVAACNKFAHDLKTGKYAAARSPAGLLLTILGLGKASTETQADNAPKPRPGRVKRPG